MLTVKRFMTVSDINVISVWHKVVHQFRRNVLIMLVLFSFYDTIFSSKMPVCLSDKISTKLSLIDFCQTHIVL
jgi:hypothetical protein